MALFVACVHEGVMMRSRDNWFCIKTDVRLAGGEPALRGTMEGRTISVYTNYFCYALLGSEDAMLRIDHNRREEERSAASW
jgi:hypothetical protein